MSEEHSAEKGRLPTERLNALRGLAAVLRDDLGLKGRWRWHGYIDGHTPSPYLSTENHGRVYVLGFRRAGMQGAQPVFPRRSAGEKYADLAYGNEIPVFEVAPDALTADDPRVYRTDIKGFRSPVADYLAAVDAETVLALVDEVERLRALLPVKCACPDDECHSAGAPGCYFGTRIAPPAEGQA